MGIGFKENKQALKYKPKCLFLLGGDEGIRTLDPCLAKAMLSQLSHIPSFL